MLLGAPGLTVSRNKKLLGAPGIATRKDATRGSWPYPDAHGQPRQNDWDINRWQCREL